MSKPRQKDTKNSKESEDSMKPSELRTGDQLASRAQEAATVVTTSEDWATEDEATFEPYMANGVCGYRCTVNGVVSYVYMVPSTCGCSPDVFVYQGVHGDPELDDTVCFLTPAK